MHWTEISDRRIGDVVVLDLKGFLTLSDEDSLLIRGIGDLLESGARHIVLNLSRLSYIDSPGIGEIVRAYTRLKRAGGRLVLCGVTPRVAEVLDATHLSSVFEIFDAEREAIESF